MQKVSLTSLAIATIAIFSGPTFAAPTPNLVRLPGHIPASVVEGAQPVERVQSSLPIKLAITLPLRNEPQLDSLLTQLYDKESPLYGKYLSSEQFTEKFSPTQKDYDAVKAFAIAHGLTVTATHSNRAVLDVSGPASTVENTFGTHLLNYQSAIGKAFYAPDSEPAVPASLANVVSGVVGLDNAETWKPNAHFRPLSNPGTVSPNNVGTGPGAGLSPRDLKGIFFGFNGGFGETMGLFELDGYNASDINSYQSYYSSSEQIGRLQGGNIPLQNVLIDGFSGKPSNTGGSIEVTLDIELMIAIGGSNTKIIVYEAPNSTRGAVDTYNRIASDNAAKEVSSSWGLAEQNASASTRNSENNAFKQMAAQGQSMFVASGDDGAYANGSSLSVQDPASQPYVTSVGGTELQLVSASPLVYKQTTWTGNTSGITSNNGGSGGGISTVWPLPSYQQGFSNSANMASTTMRNVPDVSFNASTNSEYSIYYNGSFGLAAGTSCASPLWAAFVTGVNASRITYGPKPRIGFMNPALYQIGLGAHPSGGTSYPGGDFYDIADGSTNLYYPAVTGYDLATGLGTVSNAYNLSQDLSYY